MLLNGAQKQHQRIEAQEKQIAELQNLKELVIKQQELITALTARLARMEAPEIEQSTIAALAK